MYIKKFREFVNESDEGNSVVSVAGVGHEMAINNQEDLDKEVEKYMDKCDEDCPRCGEAPEDCICDGDDMWSTHTYHRVPKGDAVKEKPKQEFKK